MNGVVIVFVKIGIKMSGKRCIYPKSTLTALINKENSCVSVVPTTRKILLDPYYFNDIKAGLNNVIFKSLKKFDSKLNGILLGYQKVSMNAGRNISKICGPHGEIEININIEYFIFKPVIGNYLEGVVNKISTDHIGCLVHEYFNATIFKPDEVEFEDWVCRYLNINDSIVFIVKDLDFSGLIPYIEGTIDEEQLTKSNMKSIKVDINDVDVDESPKKKKKKKKDKEESKEEEPVKKDKRKLEKGERKSDENREESFLDIVMSQTFNETLEIPRSPLLKSVHGTLLKEQESTPNTRDMSFGCFASTSPIPFKPPEKKKKLKDRATEEDVPLTSTQLPNIVSCKVLDFEWSPVKNISPKKSKSMESEEESTRPQTDFESRGRLDFLQPKILKKKKAEREEKCRSVERFGEKDFPITSTQIPNSGSKVHFNMSPVKKVGSSEPKHRENEIESKEPKSQSQGTKLKSPKKSKELIDGSKNEQVERYGLGIGDVQLSNTESAKVPCVNTSPAKAVKAKIGERRNERRNEKYGSCGEESDVDFIPGTQVVSPSFKDILTKKTEKRTSDSEVSPKKGKKRKEASPDEVLRKKPRLDKGDQSLFSDPESVGERTPTKLEAAWEDEPITAGQPLRKGEKQGKKKAMRQEDISSYSSKLQEVLLQKMMQEAKTKLGIEGGENEPYEKKKERGQKKEKRKNALNKDITENETVKTKFDEKDGTQSTSIRNTKLEGIRTSFSASITDKQVELSKEKEDKCYKKYKKHLKTDVSHQTAGTEEKIVKSRLGKDTEPRGKHEIPSLKYKKERKKKESKVLEVEETMAQNMTKLKNGNKRQGDISLLNRMMNESKKDADTKPLDKPIEAVYESEDENSLFVKKLLKYRKKALIQEEKNQRKKPKKEKVKKKLTDVNVDDTSIVVEKLLQERLLALENETTCSQKIFEEKVKKKTERQKHGKERLQEKTQDKPLAVSKTKGISSKTKSDKRESDKRESVDSGVASGSTYVPSVNDLLNLARQEIHLPSKGEKYKKYKLNTTL